MIAVVETSLEACGQAAAEAGLFMQGTPLPPCSHLFQAQSTAVSELFVLQVCRRLFRTPSPDGTAMLQLKHLSEEHLEQLRTYGCGC